MMPFEFLQEYYHSHWTIINQSINLFASDHMDPYHNKRKYNEMIK